MDSRRGGKLYYIHDFGDTWEHEIRCEKAIKDGLDTLPAPIEVARAARGTSSKRPRRIWGFCLDGTGRHPPEDCGGPWGYADMLAAIADPAHEEHETFRTWLGLDEGEAWDTTVFDLEAVNRSLARVR